MACIFVAEVKVHSNPPARKTFIAYVDNKDELKGMLEAKTPWHELVASRPIDTSTNVHELTLEVMEYGLRKTFEEKIAANAYDNDKPYPTGKTVASQTGRDAYRTRESELYAQFMADFKVWMREHGVPAKYLDKVAAKAWDDGHSSGYSEVVNCAHKYIEIVTL